jgi:hypothetical protein
MTDETGDSPMVLHIYSPYAHHDDATIAGTRDALEALRVSLGQVLEGKVGVFAQFPGFFVSDGEGFCLQIQIASEHELERSPLPYTADYLQRG